MKNQDTIISDGTLTNEERKSCSRSFSSVSRKNCIKASCL